LIAGSDDFAIRVFKGEEIIQNIPEKSKIMQISKISGSAFGYFL